MYHSGPLPLAFEGSEQGFGGKNCQMGVRENHAFVSPSADSRRAVVSYWQKYMHEVLVN